MQLKDCFEDPSNQDQFFKKFFATKNITRYTRVNLHKVAKRRCDADYMLAACSDWAAAVLEQSWCNTTGRYALETLHQGSYPQIYACYVQLFHTQCGLSPRKKQLQEFIRQASLGLSDKQPRLNWQGYVFIVFQKLFICRETNGSKFGVACNLYIACLATR